MTPRHVVIYSFLFGCMIIVAGAVFGPRRQVQAPGDAAVTAANAVAPDTTQRDLTQAIPAQQQATLEQAPVQPSPPQQPSAPPSTSQPEPTSQAAPPEEPSLPIMSTYEIKKQRDTSRDIARDPKGFWVRQIVAKIQDKKTDLASPLEKPATVLVEFAIGRDGSLLSKSISKSSGSNEADKTAMAMLEQAQPFPPMPEGLQEKDMTFTLPVRFH